MPLISRGVPAFASPSTSPASDANDSDYTTTWRSAAVPAWLAYDLSAVPRTHRSTVLVAWFNDPMTSPYDHRLINDVAYNNLRDYRIEVNRAQGGGPPPAEGWTTAVEVHDNGYHSRMHLVRMTGANWIRLDVLASDGSPMNADAAVNMDVYDASAGADDTWLMLGDSLAQDGLHHRPIGNVGNLSTLISLADPARFPAIEDGGTGGLGTTELAAHVESWLATFPGHYVGLAYGTNDANECVSAATFRANLERAIRVVLADGKVPVLPTFPRSLTPGVRRCGPALVAAIRMLYARYPKVVRGPDLWTWFTSRPELISADGLHPNAAGYAALRRQWAAAMLANVYRR